MMHLSDNPFYKLLKTGQTTQYAGYADDGFYEMGVAKEYDVLTLGVYSGHTHIILNAKDEPHDNACVYDRRTQLIWSRYIPVVVGPAADGKLPWTTNVNGEGIFTYVAAANAALLAGYSDWRIPNLIELQTLTYLEAASGIVNAVAFPVWPLGDWMFTSTTRPDSVLNALGHVVAQGRSYDLLKTATNFIALVRGG
jgi:hypothetical protein